MTSVLLDTNVLSELVRPKPDPKVQAFVRAQTDPLISALTIHELVFDAERAIDPARRAKLIAWIASIQNQFAGRIVDIDANVPEQARRLRASAASQGANTDPIGALIAASALTRSAAVATRNVRDFAPSRGEPRRSVDDVGSTRQPKSTKRFTTLRMRRPLFITAHPEVRASLGVTRCALYSKFRPFTSLG